MCSTNCLSSPPLPSVMPWQVSVGCQVVACGAPEGEEVWRAPGRWGYTWSEDGWQRLHPSTVALPASSDARKFSPVSTWATTPSQLSKTKKPESLGKCELNMTARVLCYDKHISIHYFQLPNKKSFQYQWLALYTRSFEYNDFGFIWRLKIPLGKLDFFFF